MPFRKTLKDKPSLNAKKKPSEKPTITKVTETYRETTNGGKECINMEVEGETSKATFTATFTPGTGPQGRRTAEGGRKWGGGGFSGSVTPKHPILSPLGKMWKKLCDFVKKVVASIRAKISRKPRKAAETTETRITQHTIRNNTQNRDHNPPQIAANPSPVINATLDESAFFQPLSTIPGEKTYTKHANGAEKLTIEGPVYTNKSFRRD